MKFTLAEPKYLKESVNIISELVNDVTFRADSDKIELIAMDPANVAMVMFKLLGSAFTEYQVDGPTDISVSLESLRQVLRRCKPNDTITVELDKNKNKLNILLNGDGKRSFSLALIDIEDNSQRVPELEFGTTMDMVPSVFDEAVEDMSVVAESVALVVDSGKFALKATSNLNSAQVDFDFDVKLNSSEEKIVSKYSLEYLKKMVKGSKLADNMKVMFSNDYPLRLEYNVIDKMQLAFILAPRVDNN